MSPRTRFSWDPEKAERNKKSHGISFEVAREVFSDPFVVSTENYYIAEQVEQRRQAIGMTRNLVLLLVVFVEPLPEGEEVIHIISARKVVKHEQSIYQDQFS